MIAPATISNCGPALAIMPGIALREEAAHLGIEGDPQRRREAAAAAQYQDQQLQQAGDADGGRQRQRGMAGIRAARRKARS